MGAMNTVECPSCGYVEHGLLGVGGDVGMAGELVVTAVCTTTKQLVDTVPLDQGGFQWALRIKDLDAPMPVGPCPESGCRSRTHEAWNRKKAICPVCGKPGMWIEMCGSWD